LGVQSLLSGTITSAITSNDSILFAAFKGYEGSFEGLYLSYDEGNNWKGINTPFINGIEGLMLQPIITSLWIYDNYLFAGTNSFGIWKVSLSDIVTGIGKKTNEIPSEFILNQNYPNPFNPTTVIEYQLPKSGFVTLKVYDILGREVRTLVNGYKTPGKYSVSFDASNLSSGAYFYRLKSNSFSSIKKMLLIR
jgi:hypothetical protein